MYIVLLAGLACSLLPYLGDLGGSGGSCGVNAGGVAAWWPKWAAVLAVAAVVAAAAVIAAVGRLPAVALVAVLPACCWVPGAGAAAVAAALGGALLLQLDAQVGVQLPSMEEPGPAGLLQNVLVGAHLAGAPLGATLMVAMLVPRAFHCGGVGRARRRRFGRKNRGSEMVSII